jgi:hypothetical protein
MVRKNFISGFYLICDIYIKKYNFMHKSFIITEEDKNRILGMHEKATKKQYLNEATEKNYSSFLPKEKLLPGVNKIISASRGPGTDEKMLMDGFKEITDYNKTDEQLKRLWSHFSPDMKYSSIVDMLRGEMDYDVESVTFMKNLNSIVSKFGVKFSYDTNNGIELRPQTITQTTNTQTTTTSGTTTPQKTEATQTNSSGYKQYVNDDTVKQIQNILVLKGYNVGKFGVDGKLGSDTANAILKALQNAKIPEEIRAKEEKPEQQQNVGPIAQTQQQQPNYTKLPS